jgi:hypothetical protein
MRRQMRAFARSLGLGDVRFVHRKERGGGRIDILYGEVTVAESLGGKYEPIEEIIHYVLHECAHWIDFHNGLYRKYYARWGYKHIVEPAKSDVKRLGVRAERHCEWLARRMMRAMYGQAWQGSTIYDDIGAARLLITLHYNLDCSGP